MTLKEAAPNSQPPKDGVTINRVVRDYRVLNSRESRLDRAFRGVRTDDNIQYADPEEGSGRRLFMSEAQRRQTEAAYNGQLEDPNERIDLFDI